MEEKSHAEESLEERVVSEEEKYEESSSSSSQSLAVGRRLPGLVVLMLEGLIVSKEGREDGTLDVTLILAPYVKKGVWVKAGISVKNSTKLLKRSVEKYRYLLPWGNKLALETIRNKGDNEWARTTIDDINLCIKDGSRGKDVVEEDLIEKRKFTSDRRKSTLSHDSHDSRGLEKSVLHRSPQRRSRRISALRKWSRESTEKEPESHKKSIDKKQKSRVVSNNIWGNNPRVRRTACKAIRSSSESQESTHKGDLDDKEVWDIEEEDDGMVYCPFTSKDIRRYINVRESIKGKATERRFIRQALHNLYRHFTSLQTFVDSIKAKSLHSVNQPFALDLVWLEYYAMYIDCLLFENLKGMWADWNEPILDLLVISFLELTVRCTPRRQYPDKLEERVKRWMKKNQQESPQPSDHYHTFCKTQNYRIEGWF